MTITLNSNQNMTATFEQLNAIFLDENGATIKSYDFAVVGGVGCCGVVGGLVFFVCGCWCWYGD